MNNQAERPVSASVTSRSALLRSGSNLAAAAAAPPGPPRSFSSRISATAAVLYACKRGSHQNVGTEKQNR